MNSIIPPATASNISLSFINSLLLFLLLLSSVSISLYWQSHFAVKVFKSKLIYLQPSSHKFVF